MLVLILMLPRAPYSASQKKKKQTHPYILLPTSDYKYCKNKKETHLETT